MTTVGHVHGRFQPVHREHLAYAQWAARETDRLIIGITNADPSHVREETADPKRHEARHNPFTYYERNRMLRSVADRIDGPVSIMPFPINRPELWSHYAPADAVHYINVLEEWHTVKADRLRERGRTVKTKEGTRTVSGEAIRAAMASDADWRADCPNPVVDVIEHVDGPARVRALWQE